MKNKNITFEQFNQEYSDLKKKIAFLKTKRKEVFKIAKALAKHAEKLYAIGNKKFYLEDETGVHPLSKKIPAMMDDFEFWRTIDIDFTI